MPSPLVLLVAGIAFLATLGGLYYKVHHDGVVQGRAEVQTQWDAANRKAEAEARAKEAADKLKKDTADAEHKAAISRLNAIVGKLRAESDRRRAAFLPAAPAASCGADVAAFDRTLYLGAYGELLQKLRGLADEGSALEADLNTARKWAQAR